MRDEPAVRCLLCVVPLRNAPRPNLPNYINYIPVISVCPIFKRDIRDLKYKTRRDSDINFSYPSYLQISDLKCNKCLIYQNMKRVASGDKNESDVYRWTDDWLGFNSPKEVERIPTVSI